MTATPDQMIRFFNYLSNAHDTYVSGFDEKAEEMREEMLKFEEKLRQEREILELFEELNRW